jgi:peptidoglycan/LPS O-acetylase OafA/YrhL
MSRPSYNHFMKAEASDSTIIMSENTSMNRSYFHNLDGLRFFGCLIILTGHCEHMKSHFGLPNQFHYFQNPPLGNSGVTLFFVLSGFLITYLLLKEQSATETISVRKFYMRRILRLWPLYFFYIGVYFIVSPYLFIPETRIECTSPIDNIWLIFLFQVSNLIVFFPSMAGLGHLWTVSVEEQFYLFWPWLVKYVKKIFLVAVILVATISILKGAFFYYVKSMENPGCNLQMIKSFLAITRIECIALGGIGAIIYYKYKKILPFIYMKTTQVITLLIIAAILLFGKTVVGQTTLSLFFMLFIINLATNPDSIIKIENKLFVQIGKMSYGIYVWHPLIILTVLGYLQNEWTILSNIIYYAAVISLTLLVSYLSYTFLEKPFLKLKKY